MCFVDKLLDIIISLNSAKKDRCMTCACRVQCCSIFEHICTSANLCLLFIFKIYFQKIPPTWVALFHVQSKCYFVIKPKDSSPPQELSLGSEEDAVFCKQGAFFIS